MHKYILAYLHIYIYLEGIWLDRIVIGGGHE